MEAGLEPEAGWFWLGRLQAERNYYPGNTDVYMFSSSWQSRKNLHNASSKFRRVDPEQCGKPETTKIHQRNCLGLEPVWSKSNEF